MVPLPHTAKLNIQGKLAKLSQVWLGDWIPKCDAQNLTKEALFALHNERSGRAPVSSC
jgi:hypothetical protein